MDPADQLMRCELFHDVLARDVLIERSGQHRSGLFTREGIIEDSLLRRHYGTFIDARIDPPTGRVHYGPPGTFIFGGYLQTHYGHFLLETLNTVWALRKHAHLPIVWIPMKGETQWLDWQLEILDLLGISRDRHVLNRGDTRYERMLVAQAGYEIQRTFHPVQEAALGQVAPAPIIAGKRLWLSRSGSSGSRAGMVNEDALEAQLESHGWNIFVPERHTVARQLEEISSAEIVSGIAGSAFHSVLLLDHVTSTLMPVFARVPKNENFTTIQRQKGFKQIRVDLPPSALQVVKKGHWHGADFVRLLEPDLVVGPLLEAQNLLG